MRHTFRLILPSATMILLLCGLAQAQGRVKVFILAGQSNMEGKGRVETGNGGVDGAIGSLRYQVDNDPANYSHLVDGTGNWVVRDDVWIWSTTDNGEKGNLTVGFGSNDFIGPELGFGHIVGDLYDEQVLLIKTAWGGKSLAVDFRPPSSGGTVGPYYTEMLSDVNYVLNNIATEFPDYSGQGCEIVGFGWHQGWNDRVTQAYNDEYEFNMANFIRDIRTDLKSPDLPFVIATTGMTGWDEQNANALSLMAAQLAMADADAYPEFAGNVKAVDTRDYWRAADVSPNSQGYHWNGNGETYYLIGDGMGDAMATMGYGPNPFYPFGDLNEDEAIDVLDWLEFRAGVQSDMSGLSADQAYLLGDLDGDFDNDVFDFSLFREAFERVHPAEGAFEAMLASATAVPEPTSAVLLALAAAGLAVCRRRTRRASAPKILS